MRRRLLWSWLCRCTHLYVDHVERKVASDVVIGSDGTDHVDMPARVEARCEIRPPTFRGVAFRHILYLFTHYYAYMIADQSDHSLSMLEATSFTRMRQIPLFLSVWNTLCWFI